MALRTAEVGLDVEPEEAARNLARMMLQISERYAQGKVGALLDQVTFKTLSHGMRRCGCHSLLVLLQGSL